MHAAFGQPEQKVANKGLKQRMHHYMQTLKKNAICAFSKEGCTRTQLNNIGKAAGVAAAVILTAIVVRARLMYSEPSFLEQNKAAMENLNYAQTMNEPEWIVEALHKGLKVGNRELNIIKDVIETYRKRLDDKSAQQRINQIKTVLNDNQDQLVAKEEFSTWIDQVEK